MDDLGVGDRLAVRVTGTVRNARVVVESAQEARARAVVLLAESQAARVARAAARAGPPL